MNLVCFHLKSIEKWLLVECSESFIGSLQNQAKAIFCKANRLLLFRHTNCSTELTCVFHLFDVSLCCPLAEIARSQRKKLRFQLCVCTVLKADWDSFVLGTTQICRKRVDSAPKDCQSVVDRPDKG